MFEGVFSSLENKTKNMTHMRTTLHGCLCYSRFSVETLFALHCQFINNTCRARKSVESVAMNLAGT